jgi:uncharacterized protein YukJ
MENYLLKHRHLEAGPCFVYLYEDEHDAPLETHTTKESSSVLLALKPQQTCNADLRRLRPLPVSSEGFRSNLCDLFSR